jgi:hypothetical protein
MVALNEAMGGLKKSPLLNLRGERSRLTAPQSHYYPTTTNLNIARVLLVKIHKLDSGQFEFEK